MCGIAGYVERSGRSADAERVRRMTSIISHRGPDDEGVYVQGPVGLGHRRLSIVDVSAAGHQPMSDPDRTAWITYNGEIYNHKALRERLEDRRPFMGASDTELLVRLFREMGPACLPLLNGIFAFAVMDWTNRELFLARDLFGVKPLYFAQDGERFSFGSEIKAMVAGGLEPRFNSLAAIDFVFTAWTADDHTLFKGVRRLPPGCVLRYSLDTGEYRIERYASPEPDWELVERLGKNEEAWERELAGAIEGAVKSQLMSDVPVGAFCSGGVDSSLVTALAARHNHDIQAFNVSCPDDPSVDEGPYAAMMARHVGVKLHTVSLTRDEFRRALVPTVWASEYPLAYVHTVPLYLLARLARDTGVKVLLSGEGADEVFGGYTGQYRQNAVSRIARSKGRLAETVLRHGISLMERVGERIGMRPATNGAPPMMHEVLTGGLRRWETKRCAAALFDRLGDALDRDLAAELLTQMQTYLLPLLHRADRASMLASVESRVPFLDQELVRIGLSVPPGMKVHINGLRPVGKAILKRITRNVIPEELIYRPKMGFTVPSSMYRGSWPGDWLQNGFVVSEFNIRPGGLRTWLEAQDDETVAWMLSLEIWGQLFMRGRSVADVSEQYRSESMVAGRS